MASVNQVVLVGNVGRDPEGREVGGSLVTRFSLATTRRWTGRNGDKQEQTQWHRIVAWGRLAELCRDHVTKGMMVAVTGAIEYREWEAEGTKQKATEIKALSVDFLTRADKPAAATGGGYKNQGQGWGDPGHSAEMNDEVPF